MSKKYISLYIFMEDLYYILLGFSHYDKNDICELRVKVENLGLLREIFFEIFIVFNLLSIW